MDSTPYQASQSLSRRQEFLAQWKAVRSNFTLPAGELSPVVSDGDLSVSPYPGLRSFRPDEADLFFGRDSQIRDLREFLGNHHVIFVLGGSGSGKSSLVRAGLLPQLNSIAPITGRPGAWYVVEFRPKLDPSAELLDALFDQVVSPVLDGAGGDELARRVGALNSAFDLECSWAEDLNSVKQQFRSRLREMLFEGDVVHVGALFDFVDETLRIFDRALSIDMAVDAPNLLILIDQFEEVFKPKVPASHRQATMSLITSVHAYVPFNLFLVVTMRSEELHRCAEFIGLAEVVNKSFYLVDLIGGRDMDDAIIGPARRLLNSWDLDAGDPRTGPFTGEALRSLHRVFDEARDRDQLSHPADQLPLMQHMLSLVWDEAVERWDLTSSEVPLEIDVGDLERLPGWGRPEGALLGTLNERAEMVLRAAVREGAFKSKLPSLIVEQLVRVAFSCLAQLDDNKKVVRDFSTIGQMLDASGAVMRKGEIARPACKIALETALEVFRRATFVNVARVYDVNHEALIRGWRTYANWIEDTSNRASRLISVDRQLRRLDLGKKTSFLLRLINGVSDWIFVQSLAKADQIAGDETSKALSEVVGDHSIFSDQWATKILEADDANSPQR